MILGLASNQDSTVSHAAIMARSLGIPAIVQLGDGVAARPEYPRRGGRRHIHRRCAPGCIRRPHCSGGRQ
ncbi:hypothetical protein H6B10_18050, partial [Gemmiger formicilis]|uniref:PEP-utilizing enzyme n=1 Tax=Gemmiger formicilis TaxID=745368 RepID=UPI001D7B604C|nr:hypothetical protein [Gemmiger formicilis]